ncbi:hypothetical protein EYF80_037512 [Liparis tanakae]|uniref:Uncharacterized protein n=1 Tax=Liparis tanakae TaxID=230148 RepID=A0A4Z2GGM2_9TELE|nr:hypothetical protein EYF80_037512 [Liparis tanakae]
MERVAVSTHGCCVAAPTLQTPADEAKARYRRPGDGSHTSTGSVCSRLPRRAGMHLPRLV